MCRKALTPWASLGNDNALHKSMAAQVAAGGDFETIRDGFHSLPEKKLGIFQNVIGNKWRLHGLDIAEDLDVALRLATQMMLHRDSLPFVHGLKAAGERYAQEAKEGKPAPEHYTFAAKSSLTDKETHDTIKFLEEF